MIDGRDGFVYNGTMLPKDPYMLLSAVNMKLRDGGFSLKDLCAEEDVSAEEIKEKLGGIGYFYDENRRAFVPR